MENINSITALALNLIQILGFVVVTYKVVFQFGARFTRIEEGISYLKDRFNHLDQKIDDVEKRLTKRIDDVEKKLTNRIDGVDKKLSGRIDGVEGRLIRLEDRLDSVEAKFEKKVDYVIEKIDKIDDKFERKFDVVFWGSYDPSTTFKKRILI